MAFAGEVVEDELRHGRKRDANRIVRWVYGKPFVCDTYLIYMNEFARIPMLTKPSPRAELFPPSSLPNPVSLQRTHCTIEPLSVAEDIIWGHEMTAPRQCPRVESEGVFSLNLTKGKFKACTS